MDDPNKNVIDGSSIIEMDVVDDASDYEMNFSDETDVSQRRAPGASEESSGLEGMKQQVAQNVASHLWQSSTQQAKKAFVWCGNVDRLRPYFDVEPHEVRARLVMSLVPSRPAPNKRIKVHQELYGPTMLIFTMIALLLYQMKTSGHSVEEGTLMGTAFGVCFGYWFGVSGLMWFISKVCNTHISAPQMFSLVGYALFGHCVVLGLTTIIHTTHDHMFFYAMWAIFGGLSTLKMVSVLTSRTAGQTQKIIVCATIALLHLCFLLYLHFAYHQIVEDLSEIFESPSLNHVNHNEQKTVAAHHVVERSVNKFTETLRNEHKLPAGALNAAGKREDTIHKVAQAIFQKVTDSVQQVMREVTQRPGEGGGGLPGPKGVVDSVKHLAHNSSLVVKQALEPAANLVHKVASNATKTLADGTFLQKMTHNLTKVAVDKTKLV